jgi:hypothetical protein
MRQLIVQHFIDAAGDMVAKPRSPTRHGTKPHFLALALFLTRKFLDAHILAFNTVHGVPPSLDVRLRKTLT